MNQIKENNKKLKTKIVKKLKTDYSCTDYQIAMIKYLLLTFLSEGSKLTVIFLVACYTGHILECLIVIATLLPLRITSGGLHFKHYWSCFLMSFAFVATCILLPQVCCPNKWIAEFFMLICLLLHHYIAPVTSCYREDAPEHVVKKCKLKSFVVIFFLMLLINVTGMCYYIACCFWTVILQSVQLVAAYMRKNLVLNKATNI